MPATLTRTKIRLFGGAVLVFALTLFPMMYRTWAFASDARGLVIIALMDPEEIPLNPYNRNSLAIRPDMAFWLLTHFDWPYERCGKVSNAMDGCTQPLVNLVGTTLDTLEPRTIRDRGYELLRYFVSKGEPLDSYFRGLAPVHEAVLFANVDYLRALLDLGADPMQPINLPEKSYDGFNAFEFAVFLEKRDKAIFEGVRKELEERISPRSYYLY